MEFPDLRRRVEALWRAHGADAVLIENKASGVQLIQELRHHGPFRPIPIIPEGSKEDRMIPQTSLIEAGEVRLPIEAPWLADLRRELCAFPNAAHDDQADALSQYLCWLAEKRREPKWIFR